MNQLITRLIERERLTHAELCQLINEITETDKQQLLDHAASLCQLHYGKRIFLRGLIEISNHCKQGCRYCGINRNNRNATRYRLTPEEILGCCAEGYRLGFRTFVLQGGEDAWFTDERLCSLLRTIKERYPDTAVTLSLGERSRASYERLYAAGADRYLLRHETATKSLYEEMHPGMSFENRRHCLQQLKEIGFQTGAGFLVGLPGQGVPDYARDLLFLQELQPQMVGVGPFIPQRDTELGEEPAGNLETTLLMLALVRTLLPEVLLPATTALGTIDPSGRERAFAVGANVVMPNLSPFENRSKYALYDGKKFVSDEAAEELLTIQERIRKAGYEPVMERGDHKHWKR